MKAVKFFFSEIRKRRLSLVFASIFLSRAAINAREEFDRLVKKYSNMTSKKIEEAIANYPIMSSQHRPSFGSTFEIASSGSYYEEKSLPRDDNNHFHESVIYRVYVFGSWFRIKNNKKYHYLTVELRIDGMDSPKKTKKIIYKIETV